MRYIFAFIFICASFFVNGQDQDIRLANEYYLQGEHEKAKVIYKDLAGDFKNINAIHNNYFFLLLETKDHKEADKYIGRLLKWSPGNIYYQIDQGILYHHEGNQAKADQYFKSFIQTFKNDTYRIRVAAEYFVSKNLPQYGIAALLSARKNTNNPSTYALELANIYRITGDKDLMVEEYLNYMTQNPSNLNYVKNSFQSLLDTPEDIQSLQNLLIDRLQKKPDSEVYAQLLIWTYLQQLDFYGAFMQARALDRRKRSGGSETMKIGRIALDNADYENAAEIFDYVVANFPDGNEYLSARLYQIRTREEKVKNTFPVSMEDIQTLVTSYEKLYQDMGINRITLDGKRSKARLQAFYLDQKQEAIEALETVKENQRAGNELIAQSKLDLGDIFLLDDQPWEATLVYSQVEKENKESAAGYEAKLRNAKLSYYKGEFALAQEHLDILKIATSREISNDAMALSLLIKDNSVLDTSDIALSRYAAIDLLLYQNKTDQAIGMIQKLHEDFPNHSLKDELWWLEANLYLKRGSFNEALALLEKIVFEYQFDLLTDDAYFLMGEIYERHLGDKEKAKEIYADLMVKYPGSAYVAESRKRFRKLRGDTPGI